MGEERVFAEGVRLFVAFVGGEGAKRRFAGRIPKRRLGTTGTTGMRRGAKQSFAGRIPKQSLGTTRKFNAQWRPEDESNIRLVLRRDPLYPLSYRGVIMQINN